MSKYILVIDLPDAKQCNGCPVLSLDLDNDEGLFDLICEATKKRVAADCCITVRPTDCPLIPVERVMDRIRSMQGERKVSGLDHWSDALDEAIAILRDEGVTE